jgi:hypothetical protein
VAQQPDPKPTDGQESTDNLSRAPDVSDDEKRADLDALASVAAAIVTARLNERIRTML